MPYKEKPIEKKYYSIGEVATMLGVATSLIRFWESEFSIIKPRKNKKGNRQFTKDDIANLKLVYHLVKEKGYTLQGAKEKLKEKPLNKLQGKANAINALKDVRSFLVSLKERLP